MRHLVTSVLFLGLTLFYAHAEALGALTFSVVDSRMGTTGRVIRERATCGLSTWRVAQNAGTELSHPIADKADRDRSPIATNVSDLVCQTLETATLLNDLPLEFLTRLIWQESRFDPRA